ncbi:MAG: hypothetical protein ABIQ18_47715 [Umezawaea sp.]
MILGDPELAWQEKITTLATRHGWTVYAQQLGNQRQHEPSLVLIKGSRVVAVFLRTSFRRDRTPMLTRFASVPGVETYVWCQTDWPRITALLSLGNLDQAPAAGAEEG